MKTYFRYLRVHMLRSVGVKVNCRLAISRPFLAGEVERVLSDERAYHERKRTVGPP